LPYRTEDDVRALFARLQLPVDRFFVFDNGTIVVPSTRRMVWRLEPPLGNRKQPDIPSKRISSRWALPPELTGRIRLYADPTIRSRRA
jgi:hypothetical protein